MNKKKEVEVEKKGRREERNENKEKTQTAFSTSMTGTGPFLSAAADFLASSDTRVQILSMFMVGKCWEFLVWW